MHVKSLMTKPEFSDNGLAQINLVGLGRLVIVAGTNGSGKSRLINTLSRFQGLDFTNSQIAEVDMDCHPVQLRIVPVVPKSTAISNNRDQPASMSVLQTENASHLGVDSLPAYAIDYVEDLQKKRVYASYQQTQDSIEKKNETIESCSALEEVVKKIVGTRLTTNMDGRACLYGKPILEAKLSPGQNILFQLAILLHKQGADLGNVLLILDEPENHLHPAACNDMIRRLREIAPDTQLWIVTHSPTVIAEFADDPEATLLFAHNGTIKRAGREPEVILKSLMGGDDGVDKLRDFTSLPSIYAQYRHAAECLMRPAVVDGGDETDDQTKQIDTVFKGLKSDQNPLRILDWGAGKARLLQNLDILDSDVATKLDYRAYDPFDADAETCKRVIAAIYEDSSGRYVTGELQKSDYSQLGTVDVVVMCNVLHEIEPFKWQELFGSDGPIVSSLSDNGHLLVVEDEVIPVGEMAHKYGFIVLDKAEFRTLFCMADTEFEERDQRGNGRLKAFLIPKACLSRITVDSVRDALTLRKDRAKLEILKLRNATDGENHNYKDGMRLGFWLQQFANSSLALDAIL
jgi:predicted ATPase